MATGPNDGAAGTATDKPMDEKDRTLLRSLRAELVKDMEVDQVLLHMAEYHVFSETDEDEIMSKSTREERCIALLTKLPRKGAKAYDSLIKALEQGQPHLAEVVLKAEQNKYKMEGRNELHKQRERGQQNLDNDGNRQSHIMITEAVDVNTRRAAQESFKICSQRDDLKEENEKSWRKIISMLQVDIENLTKENERLKNKEKQMISERQAKIEKLECEKANLEEEKERLKEKVKNLEATLTRVKAEKIKEGSDHEEEQLLSKHQKLTDEIRKSVIFTNRVHNIPYSDSRPVGVIQYLEQKPALELVAISRSSEGPGKATDVLRSFNRETCGTKQENGSWWCIDLGKKHFLLITHCTLHKNSQDPRLRKWELHGSVDGHNWKVLETKPLKIDHTSVTWSVENETTAFRCFKFLQKGINLGNPKYGIFLSRVELNGVLVEVKHGEEILGRSLEEVNQSPSN